MPREVRRRASPAHRRERFVKEIAMYCEECGRPMKNAELWQLAGDPRAPASSSMRTLCWECRDKAARQGHPGGDTAVIQEAEHVVRDHEASQS